MLGNFANDSRSQKSAVLSFDIYDILMYKLFEIGRKITEGKMPIDFFYSDEKVLKQ